MSSCKKCKVCETKTSQVVIGFDQATSTSTEYCDQDYKNATENNTFSQTVGGIEQKVTITCAAK